MLKGTHMSEEAKIKIGIASKGNKYALGHKLSEEHKQKLKASTLGRHHTPEEKLKISLRFKGKPLSAEHIKKLSESHKGQPHPWQKNKHLSEEHKNHLSLMTKRYWLNNPQFRELVVKANKGRVHSEETRNKQRQAMLGKKFSLEHNMRVSQGKRGHQVSVETRKKLRIARLGAHMSEDTKKRIGASNKGKVSWNRGKHYTKEQRKNFKVFFGDKSHFWKGGLSFEKYTANWNKALKCSIRERDHYTCQVCGRVQSDEAFAVHHIDYNKKNCNPHNLITLCRPCHNRTNHNRAWEKYFVSKEEKYNGK